MASNELLWQPSPDRASGSQMFDFLQRNAAKYNFEPNWLSMHEWSIAHCSDFWKEMLAYADIELSQSPSAIYEGVGMLGTKWFPGLRFNFAQHLLRYSDDRVAIESEDEHGKNRSITYKELRAEVTRLAAAMREMGVVKGDRVGGFLPNIPEAITAMLATASIGAIWSSCSPDFGINGVFDRFGQIEPKLLFSADGYSYNRKPINSLDRVAGILKKIPSIKKVVIIPFLNEAPDITDLDKAVIWNDFLASDADELTFEQVPFDHPLYIMYSSGTTGVPKCIVHGQGGTLLQHMKELMLHTDLHRDDKIFYFTTCGWMMWNWLVSSLGVGSTILLYEGNPGFPNMQRLWQFAERTGMTVFGTSAKYIAACDKAGINPKEQQSLDQLRAVLSTGSPLTAENFRWVYQNVKDDLQLSSICGGTDIISCFMLGNPMLPVYAGEIQCLGLGMDVAAFDANGKRTVGQKGELVCCNPFPSQPVYFWNDPDNEKYKSAYFEHYADIWRHGDFVEITERRGVVVYGRSDATLNPGGVRIGTAEIYRQVETIDEIVDSVVVGKNTPDADVEICLFVVLREGLSLTNAMVTELKQRIAQGATKRHVPKHIKQVTAIPYTISGKKVEIAVTRMIHGEDIPNRDALANPEALDQYAGLV